MRFAPDQWTHSAGQANPAHLIYDRSTRTYRLLIKHRLRKGRDAVVLTPAQLVAVINVGTEALAELAQEATA